MKTMILKIFLLFLLGVIGCTNNKENILNCSNEDYSTRLSMDYSKMNYLKNINEQLYEKTSNQGVAVEYRKHTQEKIDELNDIINDLITICGGINRSGDLIAPCEQKEVRIFFDEKEVREEMNDFMSDYEEFISSYQEKDIFYNWQYSQEQVAKMDPNYSINKFPESIYDKDLTLIEVYEIFLKIELFILMNETQYYTQVIREP